MARSTSMTVRVSGALGEFVAANIGEDGDYDSAGEYIRDLIRRDKARAEAEALDRLKAELRQAFAQPDDSFLPLTAANIIARNQS
jgi:antitoxin ParD1/3/4